MTTKRELMELEAAYNEAAKQHSESRTPETLATLRKALGLLSDRDRDLLCIATFTCYSRETVDRLAESLKNDPTLWVTYAKVTKRHKQGGLNLRLQFYVVEREDEVQS